MTDTAPAIDAAVQGLAELTLEASNLQEVACFYEDVVGLRMLARDRDRIWLAIGEHARLGLWSPGCKEYGDRGGRHVHFALSVRSGGLTALHARLRATGVEVEGPIEHEGGDRSLYFYDPAGNRVEAWDFFTRGNGRRDGVDALA